MEKSTVELIGVENRVRDALEEVGERGTGADAVTHARDADIDVEVRHDILLEPGGEVLPKLGASDETVLQKQASSADVPAKPARGEETTHLLSIPAGENDRAKRLPALLEQDTKRLDDLVHARGSGVGVAGAEGPAKLVRIKGKRS